MENHQIVLLIVCFILVGMSAFFSASELAYTALNKVRLKTAHANGDVLAGKVLKLTENYDRILSTILIGNNIVNIAVSSIATILFLSFLKDSPNLAATLSTVATTVVVVIFGEVTPKSLANANPEKFAKVAYPVLKFMTILFYPFNSFFVVWRKLLNKIFKIKVDTAITEDELITYVETAESGGSIMEHESQLIRSAIEFDDLEVDDVMIARVNVVAIEQGESIENIKLKFREHGFSRIPVYAQTIDSIIGVIHEKDFYIMLDDGKQDINDIIQSSICISPNMKISAVLKMLQKAKIHMAIVVDEFGGTEGIVTLEDIIEELVGEIWDEHDEEEILLRRVDENTFVVSGSENIWEMFEAFGLDVKEDFDSTTVGGFVTEKMEKIPVPGEKIEYENLEFNVTKANAKRVLEVKVKRLIQEDKHD